MKTRFLTLSLLILVGLSAAREAHVITFKHTLRWLDESKFPNYFVNRSTRDSIWSDIRYNLEKQLDVAEVTMPEKVVVGSIEEKENEVHSWFPNSTRYWLKTNGAMQSGQNFSARLETDQDTIFELSYRKKDQFFEPISGKKSFANLFTDITGIGTDYTIEGRGTTSGLLEFSDGQNIKIQLEWIAEITRSTTSDEVLTRITVPMVGQFAMNDQRSGEFVYETIVEVLKSEETQEKFSVFSGSYTENTFGTSVLHRVKGTWNNVDFVAEYNELFGISEIRINDETLASMIFQNCNPENLQSYKETKISKNKRFVIKGSPFSNKPKLKNVEKQEWYPLLIKNDAAPQEIENTCALLVCLFFGMAKM